MESRSPRSDSAMARTVFAPTWQRIAMPSHGQAIAGGLQPVLTRHDDGVSRRAAGTGRRTLAGSFTSKVQVGRRSLRRGVQAAEMNRRATEWGQIRFRTHCPFRAMLIKSTEGTLLALSMT